MKPYRTIWLSPKQTFDKLVSNKDSQSIIGVPIIMFGIIGGLNSLQDFKSAFGEGNIAFIIIAGVVMGIVTSVLVLGFITPGVIKLFGLIWKGNATLTQLTNVCSISFIPYTLILVYQLILISLGLDPSIEEIYYGLTYILWLWSFSLLIIGVSKVQKFTYEIALLNILMTSLPYYILQLWFIK